MAYIVLFFCNVQYTSAADFDQAVRGAISDVWKTAAFGHERIGESWVGHDVWTSGSDARISLECHLGGSSVEIETAHASKEPGGEAVAECNALIQTMLSGATDDRDLFRVIWRVAEDRFSGIPYDEMDGFEVELE